MTTAEKVKKGLRCHLHQIKNTVDCNECPYNYDEMGIPNDWSKCVGSLYEDATIFIDDMVNTIKLLEA